MFKLLFKLIAAVLALFLFPSREPGTPIPEAPDPNLPSAESRGDGHELSDASAKVIGLYVLGLFAVVAVTMATLGWMYVHLYNKTSAIPVGTLEDSFKNAPNAKSSIERDWAAIDAEAHEHLDGYRWVDRAHGIVQTPIARAMALVAAEGLLSRDGTPPPFPAPDQEKLSLMQLESTPHATNPDPH